MKIALAWIALLAALALPVALVGGAIWYAMAIYPGGIGIGQAAWMVLRGAGAVMVMMTGARLAGAFTKRPK